jgi:type II secretory ATPase GspE/PulE/Tfp pilus assembly ATPase PilB-like protein
MNKPFGSVLITGPTGSGKSTTLAAILRQINDEEINIVTLEDPIEYYVPGVSQSQIHEEIGYTFANGLRHILRQDPDVIMVGEIRDGETASLATQASLTGHVVLSTLHTNDTIGVIPRLIDMGVEKYLLAPTLNLALAQRLLRKLCEKCKVKTPANVAEEQTIKKAIQGMPADTKAGLPKGDFAIYIDEKLHQGITLEHVPAKRLCAKCARAAVSATLCRFRSSFERHGSRSTPE